ncbi:VOC family protein [bacterium]|nr:MAG: VOC family protein [bacterium]
MVTRLTHATIFVLDFDVALDFYVGKLGFTVAMDFSMPNGFRWLTVTAPKQPDLQIVLTKVEATDWSALNETTARCLGEILTTSGMGVGVFQSDDCRKTYEELSAKGVKFSMEPKEDFYGWAAAFVDPFGNSFTLNEAQATA